jgi:Tfp pilus assembly protein PilV
LQRLKDGGDYNQELEASRIAMEVEADAMREQLQLSREKYEKMRLNAKQLEANLKSVRIQFETERRELISAHREEVAAMKRSKEIQWSELLESHEEEIKQLHFEHRKNVDLVTREKLDAVKAKVEHYVSSLEEDKQRADAEVEKLRRQLEDAHLEIARLKGKLSAEEANRSSPNGTYSRPNPGGGLMAAGSPKYDLSTDFFTAESRRASPISTSNASPSNFLVLHHPNHPQQQQQYQQRNHQRQQSIAPLPPPPLPPPPPPPHSLQLTVEQVSIGPKIQDPDQEALEAGILLSSQNAQYGTNMIDSLRPEDHIVMEEYIKQGFTRCVLSGEVTLTGVVVTGWCRLLHFAGKRPC